jgi:uncharacterized protein YkwD
MAKSVVDMIVDLEPGRATAAPAIDRSSATGTRSAGRLQHGGMSRTRSSRRPGVFSGFAFSRPRMPHAAAAAALVGLLAACGSGGDDSRATAATMATPSTPANTTGTDPAGTPPAASSSVDVVVTLQLLNAARAQPRACGDQSMPAAPPLSWSAALEQAAIGHSQWMQATNTFSHTGANGSSVGSRVSATGYVWSTVGENIAAGQRDLASVIQSWLASPGHCRNIMNASFADVALAMVPGTSSNRYSTWWTMVLGRPR